MVNKGMVVTGLGKEHFNGIALHWSPRMGECVGRIGKVTSIDNSDGTARVEFSKPQASWWYPIAALSQAQRGLEELSVPAYAIVNTVTGKSVALRDNRQGARRTLQRIKSTKGADHKLVKLAPAKYVR